MAEKDYPCKIYKLLDKELDDLTEEEIALVYKITLIEEDYWHCDACIEVLKYCLLAIED